MNANTSFFRATHRHPVKRDEVATRASRQQPDVGSINLDYTGLNSYLDALGVCAEERTHIRELATAHLGARNTGEDGVTPVVWLSREAHTLLDSEHLGEVSSGTETNVTQAFLEWRLRARLSRHAMIPTEPLGTGIGNAEPKSITPAPAIARTPMPTARIEHNFVRRIFLFIAARVSMLRGLAVQTYRRLLVGV